MTVRFQNTTSDELILFHDFYHDSSEPDAPRAKFQNLTKEEQNLSYSKYTLNQIRTVVDDDRLIGFVGIYPDDDDVNIFYVVSPEERGKGYLVKILSLMIEYCHKEFSTYRQIRALTRAQNISSIKGLKRTAFLRKGSVIEDTQPDVTYEEYIFPL